ncbi:MAG: PBSX family phage terminase large subunit [Aerococcus urinaeequi]
MTQTNRVKMSEIISPAFKPFWIKSRKKEHLKYVLKGGRATGKSFHVPLRIVSDMIEFPVSAVVLRKVQNTLVKSVFAQVKEAAKVMGVSHLFKFTPSRLEATYLPRGNKIYFAGADDPDKLKSIKDAEYPIAIAWFEELAEFKTEEEVTTIENSILRAELAGKILSEAERSMSYDFDYAFYYTYNPPKRRQSWVNKKYETQFLPENTYVHHSTYLDNPHLSKQFIEEAENVRDTNPRKYDWEYLGKAIGSGVVPFDNLDFRKITDEEMARFDNIRQGNDWGYANDPLAFTRWHYDRKNRKIYAIGEIYGVKISNRELAEKIKATGFDDAVTIADSAEPKSVDEMKYQHHLRFKGAKKGPGSVEYGEKWLDDLNEIVIDPARTPNTAREFESIDYATDADGNPKTKLSEVDNHTIDSARYAFEDDMKGASIRF